MLIVKGAKLISGQEIAIIIIVGLIIYGVKKAPQIGASLGKSVQSFKRASKGIDEIDVTPVDAAEEAAKGDHKDTAEA